MSKLTKADQDVKRAKDVARQVVQINCESVVEKMDSRTGEKACSSCQRSEVKKASLLIWTSDEAQDSKREVSGE